MARRGGYGDPTPGGGLGPMAAVVTLIVGLVVVAAIMAFTPTIGSEIEDSQVDTGLKETCIWGVSGPGWETAGDCNDNTSGLLITPSAWNMTNNSGDIPTGVEVYTDNVGMITLLITIIIIAIALGYLIGI